MRNVILGILLLVPIVLENVGYAEKPKYGPVDAPTAIPLTLSNGYFRNPKHAASGFWALMPYYTQQSTPASCSAATLTMVLNAARSRQKQGAEDKNITEQVLLDQVQVEHWKERLNSGGYYGQYGVNLDQMGKITEAAFKIYGFKNVSVKVVHMNSSSPVLKKELTKALENLSVTTFLLANFNQKTYTDDTDVGHFAPVGAYDEDQDQVLIMDPDREYYAPYWVSLKKFIEGMSTQDARAQRSRGYILVSVQ